MQFTEKELELAREMKESGIEWEPEVGDWFVHRKKIYIIRDASVDLFTVFAIRSYPYDGDCVFAKCSCIQLPLWHQCRDIIADEGWHIIGFIDTPPQVEWRVHINLERQMDKETHCIEATGETDLEAMYKAIIAIKTRNKIIKMSNKTLTERRIS